jgi:hypothetical protein
MANGDSIPINLQPAQVFPCTGQPPFWQPLSTISNLELAPQLKSYKTKPDFILIKNLTKVVQSTKIIISALGPSGLCR